ncbi:nucleotide-binding protein [Frateuria sp. MAH-13]|uniref:Nucleotide-binding protein n=1 Tax=Frateuria flava TaxID=2821489 RepID=A0ABS4DJS9_9GAMM|nr:TIR domain-containing protein [Frateuria flava]MBP1473300.1 nucleotide-binding protein [Frateuria flava]
MDLKQVCELLQRNGFLLDEVKGIGYGQQARFTNGTTVNVYDSGKIVVGGKDQEGAKRLLGLSVQPQTAPVSIVRGNNKVFVVYGHDEQARTQLEAMLRRWGMEPLILDQLPSEGQTIIEKLESYTADVQFAVVLATPDDRGHRAEHADESAYRARQNVVLELGMLLSKLGRRRVAILLKQQENMERPSDIQGLIYIPFRDDLAKEAGLLLAKEMAAQGYNLDVARI